MKEQERRSSLTTKQRRSNCPNRPIPRRSSGTPKVQCSYKKFSKKSPRRKYQEAGDALGGVFLGPPPPGGLLLAWTGLSMHLHRYMALLCRIFVVFIEVKIKINGILVDLRLTSAFICLFLQLGVCSLRTFL